MLTRFSRAAAFVLAFLSVSSLLLGAPRRATADPSIIDNPDGTSDAVWDFVTPGDYALTNAAIAGGVASLASMTTWWNSTSAADFASPDSETNIDRAQWPGDVALAANPMTLVSLQPGPTGEDTWLDRGNPVLNHGADTTMVLDGRNPQSRPLVRFDLSAVPPGVVIDDATLNLYETSGVGPSFTASVYHVTFAWSEMQATWNDRLTGTAWNTAGGDWDSHVIAQITVDNTAGWKTWNITQLVDLWYRGRLPNNGVILNGPNTGADADKTFYTSDYAVDPTRRPRLDIRYRVLGATGTYVSRVGGPGTPALWQTISWNATERSLVSDEFSGPALDPKWTWTNPPATYDVGSSTPGHLHAVSSTGVDIFGAAFTGNVLADGVVGNFTATMKFTSSPTVNGQKVGLMALLGPRDWYGIQKAYVGASATVNWRVRSTVDAATTTRVDVNSGNPNPAWVRIQRAGNTLTSYTSTDGSAWTLRDTYAPAFEYPLGIRIAFFIADGASGTALTADVDYIRVTFENDATVAVSTRTGDVTPVDGTWSGWSAPYPTPSGSAMAGSSRYIEYRLTFSVTYPDHVPVVGDTNLSWFRYASSGTVETNDLVPSSLAGWGTFSVVDAPNGQSIAYEYSLDGGGGWTAAAPPADLSAVSTATGRIRFRVSLATANTLVTPTVPVLRLTYTHALDHFFVAAPAAATVAAPFSVTVTAKDALNATITSWTGTVALAARLSDGVTPGGGTLGVISVAITSGGTATVAAETYTKAETIRIHASSGSPTGLSAAVAVAPGSVNRIALTPDNATLLPFDTRVFAAQAYDAWDNPIPGASFSWVVGGGVGSLNSSSGASVLFTASPPPANGTLQVSSGPVSATATIQVVSGTPPWLAISAPAPGAHVTGAVPISYTNSSDSVSVQFEYDAGGGWTLIGSTAVLNGTYLWNTGALNFVNGALRAIVTNNRTITNTTVVSPIEVDNAAPLLAFGAVTDDQAGSGTLTISYGTDADVVRVDLSYFDGAWSPIGSDLTVDGLYVWTPGAAINGVTLRGVAVDDVGLTGTDSRQGVGSFTLGPQPPAIAAIPDLQVRVGAPYVLNLTFYVSDPDTPLAALAVSVSDSANVTANPGAYPSLSILYAAVGTYPVTLWVSDGTDTAWRIVRILASANRPPSLVAALPSVAFDEDSTAWDALGAPATAFFSDLDGDPLAFVVLDGTNVLSRVNANDTVDLWGTANWSGAQSLRIRATDPTGAFAEAAFLATVRPLNDGPILVAAFAGPAFDEDTILLDAFFGAASLRFLDVDGDPLTIIATTGGNVSARVNPGNTIDLWSAANWSGTEAIRIRATDPSGAFAETTVLVTVRPVNDAPVVVLPFASVSFDEDTVLADAVGGSLTPHFLDVDGDVLTFTILGGTQLNSRVNAGNTLDLWASANWSGSETLRVQATDPSGGFVEASFVALVRPVNDAPVLAAIPLLEMTAGTARTLDLRPYVSDIDTNLSQLVVTTDSPHVRVNGLVMTMAFPDGWSSARFNVTLSDGSASAVQAVRATIYPPWWKSLYFLPVPPLALVVVIGVFAQRARWRPAKAFLVDERKELLREFTLDRTCDVTFDQVRDAGALDAVEKAVKVSKYHAQTVRGDALAITLLAYGPVSEEQIEFAREMLVNVQDKFEDAVKARLEEARAEDARLAAERAALEKAQAALDARSRAFTGAFDAMTTAQAKIAADASALHSTALDQDHREALLRQERQSHEAAKAALAEERKEFQGLADRLQGELHGRKEELDALNARLHERQAQLNRDVQAFEAMRLEKTQWIASKDIELEAREHTLAEKEAQVRAQAEENARVLADLAAREETLEVEGDRLERLKADLEVRKAELDATAKGLDERAGGLRDLEARKADEFRAWQSTMESQQGLLREQKESFERESRDAQETLAARQRSLEAKEAEVASREAKARSSIEWAMRIEDESKARDVSAAETLAAANALRAEVDAERATLARLAADLEARERGLAEETRRQAQGLAERSDALRAEEAAFAERRAQAERDLADLEARKRETEAEIERRMDSIEQRSLILLTREEELASLKESLDRDRSDADASARQLEARRLELDQLSQRNEEAATRLRAETERLEQSIAAREAELIAERERLERESRSLQETLGARAEALAAREKVVAARATELGTKADEIESRSRELDNRERETAANADEIRGLAATVTNRQAAVEARATELEEAARRFAAEQEAKRREWDSLQAVMRTQEARSKSEVEAKLGQIAAKASELEKRDRELSEALAKVHANQARLAEREEATEAREAQAAEASTRAEQRIAELRALEIETSRAREALAAERAAWGPRYTEEMKQLEATRDAAAEQQQKAEKLLEDAQRRATVAEDAERAAKRKLEDLSTQQMQFNARRAEVEKAERGAEAHAADLQEASRKLVGREMELAAMTKDVESRKARAEAKAQELAAAEEDLRTRRAAVDQEATHLAKSSAEVDATRRTLEADAATSREKLAELAEREKAVRKRETESETRSKALSGAETDVAKREAALSEKEGSLRDRLAKAERMRLEVDGLTAKADEDRRTAAAAREEANALRKNADAAKGQVESQQAEVAKHMKFLQKKAVETLDREDQIRKREEKLAEQERILESKFEIVETKERSMEFEREEAEQKLTRLQTEVDRLKARLSEAEKGGAASADLDERTKDIENRLKIIQRKAMELLDREEKVRQREEELRAQAGKVGARL